MSALSSILNADGAEQPAAPEAPEAPFNSLPSQSQWIQFDPLQPNGGGFDVDFFLQQPEEVDFSNSHSVDFAAYYNIQDGVTHWADNQAQGYGGDSLSRHLDGNDNGGSSISQSQQDSSIGDDSSASSEEDVEMLDGTEESSPSDQEMADDLDKVCYGMVCRPATLPASRPAALTYG